MAFSSIENKVDSVKFDLGRIAQDEIKKIKN